MSIMFLIDLRTFSSTFPPVVPFFPPSSGRFSYNARTRRNSDATQSAKADVLSRANERSSCRLSCGITPISVPSGSGSASSESITSSGGTSPDKATPVWWIERSPILMFCTIPVMNMVAQTVLMGSFYTIMSLTQIKSTAAFVFTRSIPGIHNSRRGIICLWPPSQRLSVVKGSVTEESILRTAVVRWVSFTTSNPLYALSRSSGMTKLGSKKTSCRRQPCAKPRERGSFANMASKQGVRRIWTKDRWIWGVSLRSWKQSQAWD